MDRGSYTRALWGAKLNRQLTANAYLIGRALLRRADRAGRCWPSCETLAADVGCCAKTASRAIAALRDLGLLDWKPRRGVRYRRASNLYVLAIREGRKPLESSSVVVSHGQLSAPLASALGRLGAALGVAPGDVMPWLTPSRTG